MQPLTRTFFWVGKRKNLNSNFFTDIYDYDQAIVTVCLQPIITLYLIN